MSTKRLGTLIILLVIASMLLVACGAEPATNTPVVAPAPATTAPAQATATTATDAAPTSTTDKPSGAVAKGTLQVAFDAALPSPPPARIYLIRIDGGGEITADMPQQPAGQPFSISVPAGLYNVYARSAGFEDIAYFALWDLDSTESPPLARIDIRPGEKTGPLTLVPPPDACSDRYALPASPDNIFPATNNEDYRMLLGCK